MHKQLEQVGQRSGGVDTAAVGESWRLLRFHVRVGGWLGSLVFIVAGAVVGAPYGWLGGLRFFSELTPFEQAASVVPLTGTVIGTALGLLCVWAVVMVLCAFLGALVYWLRFRSFPLPVDYE